MDVKMKGRNQFQEKQDRFVAACAQIGDAWREHTGFNADEELSIHIKETKDRMSLTVTIERKRNHAPGNNGSGN
jgi:hypothetical protein